uniref:Uncharacterized protein n=1 Tax=Arundo donax TaxID=35708 RepID=A0A0A8ZWA9_ARUDO
MTIFYVKQFFQA